MSFGIVGFGGSQLYPHPQVFQALALGGYPPVPPVQPYGTPNQNVVPVKRSGNPSVPVNLTLSAQPFFQALLKLNPTVVGFQNKPLGASAPNTTSGVLANKPAVNRTAVVDVPAANPSPATAPVGPISFSLTEPPSYVVPTPAVPSASAPAKSPELTSAPSMPPSKTPQYIEPVSGSLVQRIVQTIAQLAATAVYPAPVFSFKA